MNTSINFFFYSMNELTILYLLHKAIVNGSGINAVSTNSNVVHAYEHTYLPNDGSKNQLNNYLSNPLMPYPYL